MRVNVLFPQHGSETEKTIEGKSIIKARLVARGFEEKEKDEMRKDSPTVSKENIRLMLTITSSRHWQIRSLDVKSAVLQGKAVSRKLYLKPPHQQQAQIRYGR